MRRFFAQKENNERLKVLYQEMVDAQLSFQTLTLLVNDVQGEQDKIYNRSDIFLAECYAIGEDWEAYNGVLDKSNEKVVIKHYKGANRKARHEEDIKAFKNNWHGNLLQYIGRSHAKTEHPYNLFRGITSDRVSTYIAQKLAEDNKKGSVEALKLLRDLTNAMAFTVTNTKSSSFDISKVHLNARGNIVLVNLEPCRPTNQISKNDMPYWRSWQEICIELLAGDPRYEPNPSIECYADTVSQSRLEHLRLIVGHIHQGGARFKETSIATAFRSEAELLSQALEKFNEILLAPQYAVVPRDIWHRTREFHYVLHLREPLSVDIGDIGYITGDPPRFVRLANVHAELITDGWRYAPLKIEPLRFSPVDRWTTTVVEGVTRHAFRLLDSDATHLADWRKGRARLQKDFLLRRLNRLDESGLVVDCAAAWKVLSETAVELAAGHTQRSITASNLILVAYFKQQTGSATFRLNKEMDAKQWRELWGGEGCASPPEAIYFYESPPGGPNGVWGYFSFSPVPGSPHKKWTPERDDAGERWGWTFQCDHWTVEISKPNIKQYIRYVQLASTTDTTDVAVLEAGGDEIIINVAN
ncbi:hypothetical protein B0H10DRAFT_568119 [Mycena sp. CBHHK59/15]|nr:hypothetical protein B0H10DRAFT_568119 [Mycena sp. CBHHK59/15]